MQKIYLSYISKEASVSEPQVEKTIALLQEGATVPFISRYRKEVTGGLDDVQVHTINTLLAFCKSLEDRKKTICSSLTEQDVLSDELLVRIQNCVSSQELEDLYLPYKPKRKTRASVARQKGLEPLAQWLYAQKEGDVKKQAQQYLSDDCSSLDDALQGARDIIAEWISEDAKLRSIVRSVYNCEARILSKLVKKKEAEGEKYRQYFDFSEPLHKSPSHRILAIMRAHKEGILRVTIKIDDERMIQSLRKHVLRSYTPASKQVGMALEDSYARLLSPSIETECYTEAKKRADAAAITVFADNLRQLLLLPPLGQKRTLGIDPGYRTGCKVVCVDDCGNLLHNETIYPHPPQSERVKAMKKIAHLVSVYDIQAIAIGNGTASRETESFIQQIAFPHKVQVFMVNEAGASVYSASKIAREEFPQYDVTVRGAVSIARRLQDPLSELVKIDPKSIGVGQYQHDVNQNDLQESLDAVVERCVNLVGVELNTASKHLLAYVAGVGPALAEQIVHYRTEHGAFRSRADLLQVPKLGKKTFEQCAGFLRIRDAAYVLDATAVHPERYGIVEKMAGNLKTTVSALITEKALRDAIRIEEYVCDDIGLPTLQDIMAELEKPGRDPREKLTFFSFDPSLKTITDVKEGTVVPGIITNITNFGAFVDIGIKQNGLLHISQISNTFISNPAEVLSLNQQLQVKVVSVDVETNRIQLSLKDV